MELLQILEALAPHQEQDAVRISHDGPDAIQDTRNPELPKFRDESPGIHAGDESRLTNS